MKTFIISLSLTLCLAIGTSVLAQSNASRHSSDNSDTFDSGWRLCNQSDYEDVYVAYSYFADGDWVTKGWRRIDYDKCEVFQTKITNNTAYYFAISGDEKAQWDGDINLCAHDEEQFEYFGDDIDCTGGYRLFPFYALDLRDQVAVTRNLTSN